MHYRIALLPGDGIGPEVAAEGVSVLKAVGERFGHRFDFAEGAVGGCAIDATGHPLPPETLDACRRADAVLLGAVGGPKWSSASATVRPEQGLLALRGALGVFANLRPVRVYPALVDASTLRPDVVAGVDLVIVRELTGGLYFGKPQERRVTAAGREAVDTLLYAEAEIERLMRVAFELALQRAAASRAPSAAAGPAEPSPIAGRRPSAGGQPKVTSVDKANVLASSRLWREVAHEVARDYPDVAFEDMLVDACAMQLVRRPLDFDVIATENMFGDILSDEAAMLAGSMGMLPSASVAGYKGQGRAAEEESGPRIGGESSSSPPHNASRAARASTHCGLYEPIHGSAPDIAGQDIANPLATILSVAMMLRLSFFLEAEAAAVEAAVDGVLRAGYRTPDIMRPGMQPVGTREMGTLVVRQVLEDRQRT